MQWPGLRYTCWRSQRPKYRGNLGNKPAWHSDRHIWIESQVVVMGRNIYWMVHRHGQIPSWAWQHFSLSNSHQKNIKQDIFATMLSILRKARLKDKEMRILMLYALSGQSFRQTEMLMIAGVLIMPARRPLSSELWRRMSRQSVRL